MILQNNHESPEVPISDKGAYEPDIPECQEPARQPCRELPGDGASHQQCPGGCTGRGGCR